MCTLTHFGVKIQYPSTLWYMPEAIKDTQRAFDKLEDVKHEAPRQPRT